MAFDLHGISDRRVAFLLPSRFPHCCFDLLHVLSVRLNVLKEVAVEVEALSGTQGDVVNRLYQHALLQKEKEDLAHVKSDALQKLRAADIPVSDDLVERWFASEMMKDPRLRSAWKIAIDPNSTGAGRQAHRRLQLAGLM